MGSHTLQDLFEALLKELKSQAQRIGGEVQLTSEGSTPVEFNAAWSDACYGAGSGNAVLGLACPHAMGRYNAVPA